MKELLVYGFQEYGFQEPACVAAARVRGNDETRSVVAALQAAPAAVAP